MQEEMNKANSSLIYESNLYIENHTQNFNHEELPLKTAFNITINALQHVFKISLYFIDLDEMFNLNNQLRMKSQPTDVISVPEEHCIGEIFICPEYINNSNNLNHRATHLFIHGMLHIAGYIHDSNEEFESMSKLEIKILKQLNIGNPYV